jgi:cytochrome b6-f complex iron-sulfur subunit
MFLVILLAMSVVVLILALSIATPRGQSPTYVDLGSTENFEVGVPLRSEEFTRAWIVKLESGEFIALSSRSTHLGCTVPWRPDFTFQGEKGWFRDPCSGTTWSITGDRVFGPAPRDLDQYVVESDSGAVRVFTGQVLCGGTVEPLRVVGRAWPCDSAR